MRDQQQQQQQDVVFCVFLGHIQFWCEIIYIYIYSLYIYMRKEKEQKFFPLREPSPPRSRFFSFVWLCV